MKILHIITKSELGGAQSVLANIVNALCHEHEITVIAGEGDGKMFDNISQRVHKIFLPCLRRNISFYNDLKTYFFLRKINKELNPDIVHLHSSKVGLLGRIAFPKSKIVYTVHGFDSIRLAFRRLLPIERSMQKRCAAIVGVSKYDLKMMESEGINNNLHCVINGIIPPMNKKTIPFAIPSRYKKHILCIARISTQKKFDLFLDVAKQLPDYAFIWIGNLKEIKNAPQNVFMMGNLQDANQYCKYADLLILPSNYEGLPIVIIEAMSYGKPIVASNVGGISEIVRNGQNGYTVENTIEDFTTKIQSILNNETLYQKMSEQSLEIFKNELTAEKMVSEYMKIYQDIYNNNQHE